MSDTRYHFFRKKPGLPPAWWSTRTNRSGLMDEWIRDLEQKYRVVRHAEQDCSFLLLDREAA